MPARLRGAFGFWPASLRASGHLFSMEVMAARRALKLTEQQTAAIARALADPRRFEIFEQIARADSCPCSALSVHESISPATISHHLKELAEAGLIDSAREGRTMRLSVRRAEWTAYLKRLQSF